LKKVCHGKPTSCSPISPTKASVTSRVRSSALRPSKSWPREQASRVKDLYWALGQYDIVVIADAPDDMTMTTLGLTLGKSGNVRTQTLRAFSADEMSKILAKVA